MIILFFIYIFLYVRSTGVWNGRVLTEWVPFARARGCRRATGKFSFYFRFAISSIYLLFKVIAKICIQCALFQIDIMCSFTTFLGAYCILKRNVRSRTSGGRVTKLTFYIWLWEHRKKKLNLNREKAFICVWVRWMEMRRLNTVPVFVAIAFCMERVSLVFSPKYVLKQVALTRRSAFFYSYSGSEKRKRSITYLIGFQFMDYLLKSALNYQRMKMKKKKKMQ